MKKSLAIVLVVLLSLILAVSCGKKEETKATTAPSTTTTTTTVTTPAPEPQKTAEAPKVEPTPAPVVEKAAPKKMVYATSSFGMKFSPFFAATAYDQEVVDFTQGGLLAADRGGAIIYDGINGETHSYNGTDYFYQGMGSVEVVQNADGTVDYKLTMRDDIKFSDGTPATIDDVIFGIYVLADPTYDGSSTIYAQPIIGMSEYYNSMKSADSMIYAAGKDNTDFSKWTKETQDQFWADLDKAGEAFAQEIVDYVVANYAPSYYSTVADSLDALMASPELQVKLGMSLWGYDSYWKEGATAADYWAGIVDAYGGDILTASDTETAGMTIFQHLAAITDNAYSYGISAGDDVKSIAGIEKTGKYSLTVHMSEFDATSIYNMSFTIVPLHYYGDPALFNGVDSFGFVKGDLSGVRAKTTQPLGCGPYVFESYNNGVVTLKANEYYYTGKPVIDTILFQEATDSDYVPGIIAGTFDIAAPSISDATLLAIKDANSNKDLVGDTLTTYLVDYRGYGYIGINANLVNVGGDPASEASKNLRKGIMTVLSVYRETVINSYYGDRASVIQYPISNTSWAAPQPTDVGYQIAYSRDVNGNPIYDASMNDEQKYEAALQAAVGFFQAAGYTWDGSKFTAAPEGAKMVYEFLVPGSGEQDHPAYGIAVGASEALAKIGITLMVNDCTSTTWNNALEANTAELWCAAWQSTVDPDMYQVYHSTNADGKGTNSNHYQIKDDELDALIIAGRGSSDTDFRKATYKKAMEIIMDWGVELPTYQRKDCYVTSSKRIDNSTMPKDMTPYWVWAAEIDTLDVL